MAGFKYTLEHQGRGQAISICGDRVWYDCPMLDIPETMVATIKSMPDNVVAITLVAGRYREHSIPAAFAALDRGMEVIEFDPDTLMRDRVPRGF